jgi:CBS domain-containing protein
MEGTGCGKRGSAVGDDAGRQCVRDVMLTRPKTLPAEATVADLRRMFTNPHVESALLVDGSQFVGLVDRGQVDERSPDDLLASALAQREKVTIRADASVADAVARMDGNGSRRLVVVAADDTTVEGLLCLSTDRRGFCG